MRQIDALKFFFFFFLPNYGCNDVISAFDF